MEPEKIVPMAKLKYYIDIFHDGSFGIRDRGTTQFNTRYLYVDTRDYKDIPENERGQPISRKLESWEIIKYRLLGYIDGP